MKLETPQTLVEGRTQPVLLGTVPLSDAERRAQVWERRLRGFSYDGIYRDMLAVHGKDALPAQWSPKMVYGDCVTILNAINNEYKETAAEMVDIELNRFDQLLSAVWPTAMAGDLNAVTKVLDISRERRKMMGLDRPDLIQVDWRVQVADLLERGVITPQSVAQELGEEALIEVNTLMLERRNDN